ncbi:hypothetical protein [Helicobacter felis]|nr:hypothetical protein [Helicobacter felis]
MLKLTIQERAWAIFKEVYKYFLGFKGGDYSFFSQMRFKNP